MTDRVSERLRAAQLARHYRDQEGLSIAEIARRLGRAEGTVNSTPEMCAVVGLSWWPMAAVAASPGSPA